MVVDEEAVVLIASADIIEERRAAECTNSGHVRSNSAVFHYL